MESVWHNSVKGIGFKERDSLKGDIKTDTLIIGGGMCGVLTAYRLTKMGVSCVLAEAKQIGSGVTGNTTAKITAQHSLIYADLIKKFGTGKANQYYEINNMAVKEYKRLSEVIPCDFNEKTAFVYSIDNREKLELEADAYRKLGIKHQFSENPPLPVSTVGALGMENQAQFNPLKLLNGLAGGLDIYENTFVTDISGNRAITKNGSITAKHIILATHFPLVNVPGLYFMKMYQHRSYVIALEKAPDLGGMYLDEQKSGNSFRNYNDLLLIGGGDHRTGKKGGGYEKLEILAKRTYPAARQKFRWAAQDCMTLDSVPYIGIQRKATPNLYVATGFNKWGMTGAIAASMVLCDLITKGKSEYEALYSPQRSVLHPQLFINLAHSSAGLLSFGKRCTHMGCALKWNRAERTWDCPCHGSRFDEKGQIIDNPSKKELFH